MSLSIEKRIMNLKNRRNDMYWKRDEILAIIKSLTKEINKLEKKLSMDRDSENKEARYIISFRNPFV